MVLALTAALSAASLERISSVVIVFSFGLLVLLSWVHRSAQSLATGTHKLAQSHSTNGPNIAA